MLEIFCDGSYKPLEKEKLCYAWIAYDEGRFVKSDFSTAGSKEQVTNVMAEYLAIISALKWLSGSNYKKRLVTIYSDSQLCVNQMNGSSKVNTPQNILLNWEAGIYAKRLSNVRFKWIPREHNKLADKLIRNYSWKDNSYPRSDLFKRIHTHLNRTSLKNEEYYYWSAKEKEEYRVNPKASTCTCHDYIARCRKIGAKCKHLLALEFLLGQEVEVKSKNAG